MGTIAVTILISLVSGIVLWLVTKLILEKITLKKSKRIELLKEEILNEEIKKDLRNFMDKLREFKLTDSLLIRKKLYFEMKKIEQNAHHELKHELFLYLHDIEYIIYLMEENKSHKKAEENLDKILLTTDQPIAAQIIDGEISERAFNKAKFIFENQHLNLYSSVINSIEKDLNIKIAIKTSEHLKPFNAALLKFIDNSFMIRFYPLTKESTFDEIAQVHFAVGHELAHLILNHEFVSDILKRVSSVLIEQKTSIQDQDKEGRENHEANVFSITLFCQYLKTFCPDLLSSVLTAQYIYNLVKNHYSISKNQIQRIIDELKH